MACTSIAGAAGGAAVLSYDNALAAVFGDSAFGSVGHFRLFVFGTVFGKCAWDNDWPRGRVFDDPFQFTGIDGLDLD